MLKNDLNKIQADCTQLLLDFFHKEGFSAKDIFRKCKEKRPDLYERYNEGTWSGHISKIRNRQYESGIATNEFLNILLEMQKDAHNDNDITIIFYYWSEGAEDNFDSDQLKTAYISMQLNDLRKTDGATCSLLYPNKRTPKKGIVKKLFDEEKLSFQFNNGTSILMFIGNENNIRDKFYKGTYISSPHGHIAAGAALFQIKKEKVTKVMNENIPNNNDVAFIATEIYKKRLLVLSEKSCFNNALELQTKELHDELERLQLLYIRYRKSETDGKYYGDLIKIETTGRVVYKGAQNMSVNGRCFIQKSVEFPNAKNLIIEFYQERDTQKLSFEYRHPHSFMIFDIRNSSGVFDGHLLKPREGYYPHGSKCFLIKVITTDFDENNFDPSKFESADVIDLFNRVEHYHALPDSTHRNLVENAFIELSKISFE